METNSINTKKTFKTAIHAAIAYLIGMGVIENDGDVAAALDEGKGNLSAYKNGNRSASKNFVIKFEETYGLKLKDFDPSSYIPKFINPSELNYQLTTVPAEASNKIHYILDQPEEIYVPVDDRGNELIPITDLQIAAGGGIINEKAFETFENIQLPERLIKTGTHLAVKIKGDSMAPTLQDGSFMIIRRLEKNEWQFIRNEHIYAITYRDTETGEVKSRLKRIKNRISKGILVCMSDNPDKATYGNFNIEMKDVINVWHAEWYLSAKMPNIHDQYYSRLQRLEDLVEDLVRKLNR